MRKYGKYEKRPENADKKREKEHNPLLQTYLTSLLCLVLCVSMFFGTTYAWFSSEVTSKNNEIYIGTLDVGLYKKTDTGMLDLSVDGNTLFDGNIRWEPGFTAMETVIIKNEGDLAFLYELTFANNGTEAEALKSIGENFEVYIHKGDYADGEVKPATFADIEKNSQLDTPAWQPVRLGKEVATLADILDKGLPVFGDSISDVRAEATDPTAAELGPNDSKPTEHTYIIALHMKEDTSDEKLMGRKIHLNVRLEAYQLAYEEDAFGANYDLTELEANVIKLGETQVNLSKTETLDLDETYQFLPVESAEAGSKSPYKDYIADYVIWADKDIQAESIALAGYYKFFCDNFNEGYWVPMTSTGTIKADEVNKDNPIRLVKELYPVTYELLCQFGNDGIGFLCGIADLDNDAGNENSGIVITVELRLYEVDENGNETGKFIVVGEPQTFECE